MKNTLFFILMFISLATMAQTEPKPTPADTLKNYTIKKDTVHVVIPDALFNELKQIELNIPALEKRKNEIYNDILIYNQRKLKDGFKYESIKGQFIIFSRQDTVKNKPAVIPPPKKKN